MIRYVTLFLLCGIIPLFLKAQDTNGNYNPFVNQGIISPAPLWPLEVEGKGAASFNIGNTGDDALTVFPDQYITMTITLSNGTPDHSDPLSAVSGSSADLFSWTYDNGTYTAHQTSTIPPQSLGVINIAYKVTQNSSSPGSNGFNVNLTPAPYQTTSNAQSDDAVSSYTYTEIWDYGDAPISYGIAYHSFDFSNCLGTLIDGEFENQSSSASDGDNNSGLDDEDGVTFPAEITQGETINITVTVKGIGWLNAWIDWNGDGDFDDVNERTTENVSSTEGTEMLTLVVPESAASSAPTHARFRLSSSLLSSSSGFALGGEVEDYMISILSSISAPSIPTGLAIDEVTTGFVSIFWNASSDIIGVEGYRIYRDGIASGTSTGLTFTDNTVNDGQSYSYSVSAFNAANYESAQSAPVSVTIDDVTAPSIPSGLTVTSSSIEAVIIYWNASTDNVGVSGYRVYRDGSFLASTSVSNYSDQTVSTGNSYAYTVTSYDAAGNESAVSAGVTANTGDSEPPTIPGSLQVASNSDYSVSLLWEPSTDNVDVSGYQVYRSGVLFETTLLTSFTDSSVNAGQSYTYTIRAFDAAGNFSGHSAGIVVSINDESPPSMPSGLHATSVSTDEVSIAWEESDDNVGVNGYRVYRNGGLLGSVTGLSYMDNTVSGEPCTFTVSAFDGAGNESPLSSELAIKFNDTTAPDAPTGLIVTSAAVNFISISWNPSTDNIWVTGYKVYRLGVYLEMITGSSYVDTSVSDGKTYSYSVSAIDAAGNESGLSNLVAANTHDITPPSVPTGLIANSVTSNGITLSWDDAVDDVEVVGYKIYRFGVFVESVSANTYMDEDVIIGSSYSYTVSAIDAAGNESVQSDLLTLEVTSSELKVVSQLSFFPNPSDGRFIIDMGEESGRFILQLFSSSGSMVANEILDLDRTILNLNYSKLQKGIYFARIFNSESQYHGKLIIVK